MIKVLRETHEAPKSVAHSLEIAGGINRFHEPNYRAVWGWNRLAWIGGKFAERDPATGSLLREIVELRQEPKYPAVNRWHIEKWMPPETYGSPRAWWAQTMEIEGGRSIPALGPYPARGEPYVSGGIHFSMCQRFTAGYFGSWRSSTTSRSSEPVAGSRSANLPPIHASRFHPHTAR